MSNLVLYSKEASPPCRAVLLTGEAIGVTFDIHDINLSAQEQLSKEFLKLNPSHTVPALDDNGFILWDSHAIMGYLVNKYAKNDTLYPKDPQKRAIVDQLLHFDTGVVFNTVKGTFKPIILGGQSSVPNEQLDAMEKIYGMFEKILEGKKWLTGDAYTLADISCHTSVAGINIVKPMVGFPNVQAWFKRCQEEFPGYERVNVPGQNDLETLLHSKLA